MNRLTKGVFLTTLGLGALLVVGSIGGNFYLGARLATAQNERVEVSATLDQVQEEYNGLYREYTDATGGEPDAATPSQVNKSVQTAPGRTGAAGVAGPVGPRGLMGERGQTGETGPAGTPGERGEDGADGANGANGLDGFGFDGSDGLDGQQGATGETGAAGATGPQGATGPAGPAGPAGRGVASVTCEFDGSWTVTYTDGTSSPVGGMCRLPATPVNPEPAPETGTGVE